ncbi:MAG TPA: hypothetical protein H9667_11235 [Firmicutes bacterium]|nr:hypothetical protein [Bacillota bacterium]
MPIIEAKGESAAKESEPFIIQNAIEMIEKASEYKGRPYPDMPSFPSTSNFSVSFSLIFPSEADINSFMEFLKSKN